MSFDDPYLAWSWATGFAGHAATGGDGGAVEQGIVPLLLKIDGRVNLEQLRQVAGLRLSGAIAASGERPRYVTAHADVAALPAVQAEVPHLTMALPRRRQAAVPGNDCGSGSGSERRASQGALVIGAIDSQCAFLNRDFCRSRDGAGALQTRILGLWDQRRGPADGDAHWRAPAAFGYGREIDADAIDALLAGIECPADEARRYRDCAYLCDTHGNLIDEHHGGQVLDIAGGLPLPHAPAASAKPAFVDAAARAALVFVGIPEPGPFDGTGAAADAYLIDALHYIVRRAGDAARIVVTLSIGALAGSHDGDSLLEQAIDQLLDDEPRLTIVVAAGNAAAERWHARGELAPGTTDGSSAALRWRTMPGDATDSFLELWLRAERQSVFDRTRVAVVAPDGRHLDVGIGEVAELRGADGRLQARLDLRRRLTNEKARAQALLSLAPTAGPRAGVTAGVWHIDVRHAHATEPCRLSIWLQRDTPGNRPFVLQSELEALSPDLRLDGATALSSMATGDRTIRVGAARASDGRPSLYSPGAVDIYGVADESAAIAGLMCTGLLSGQSARLDGTSAAAPVVARALAAQLMRGDAPPGLAAHVPGYGDAVGGGNGDRRALLHRLLRGSLVRPARRPPRDAAAESDSA